ncbi:MAG: UDP-N-acetylglucosamine--N-acetylmuramyl-(pentapeptide) pyrophosphoryl-undecaprenol N-acetylglucosamine transferase [Rhodothermales bacterium]|jgi:UDP-N-acetylglucosamine--N-acetylmuramyl-(pentapeptide) pyrophosphoryl-undecaprenol N-acetylglucosamine transferase
MDPASNQAQDAAGQVLAIACGGTGGHFFPGVAVGRAFKERGGDVVMFIGGHNVEAQIKLAESAGLRAVHSPALRIPQNKLTLPIFALRFLAAIIANARLLRREGAAIGLTMGSFASAPMGLGIKLLGRPLVVHDANAVLGRANRLLRRVADHVCLGLPVETLLGALDTSIVGLPVREAVVAASNPLSDEARLALFQDLDLNPDLPVLMIFGGSLGARHLNETVLSALPGLAEQDLQLVMLTGADDNSALIDGCKEHGVPAQIHTRRESIEKLYAVADFVICRAGGSTIAELAIMGRAAVFVPYPQATDNHQHANAMALVTRQAGVLLDQKELDAERFLSLVREILSDPEKRIALGHRIKSLARPHAASDIVDILLCETQIGDTCPS